MRKSIALILLCTMLSTACTGQPIQPENMMAVQVESAGAAPPVEMQQESVIVAQGEPYAWPGEDGRTFEWLANYRAFPAEYSTSELNKALDALPKIHIETPQNGDEKIYLRDDAFSIGFLTSGTLTKADIDALVDEIAYAKAGQTLQETLAKFNLTYEFRGQYRDETFPLFDERTEQPYLAVMRELRADILCVTIEPPNLYRGTICHLVFRKEDDDFRFAAMYLPFVEYRGDDFLITEGDQLYFACCCEATWGTGVYANYINILPLQEGAYEILQYQQDGYECPWQIAENLEMSFPKVERMPDGGLHFIMQGRFWYDNYSDIGFARFSDVFQGTATWHVFDDGDGRGLYTYARDMKFSFSSLLFPGYRGLYTYARDVKANAQSEQLQEALIQRISLMLRAEDEGTCLLAENFLWELDIEMDGYPYKTQSEIYALQEKLEEEAYEPQLGSGQRFYIGNAEPLPAEGSSLTEKEIISLEQSLAKPNTNITEVIQAAGLTLPDGVAVPDEKQGMPDDMLTEAKYTREFLRHEEGDALVLEVRIQNAEDLQNYKFESISLLFLRAGVEYDFITAVVRKSYTFDEFGTNATSYIVELDGLYYLHYNTSAEAPVINGIIIAEDVWVPFARGGFTTRFRMTGGCMLGNMTGRPLQYSWDLVSTEKNSENASILKTTIYYYVYPVNFGFDLPLSLYNDKDGKGFYSLDANCRYFFSDILTIPYAREQIEGKLALRAQSTRRNYRAIATELRCEIFGD